MIHFDGNSSQHFSFEVEHTNNTLVGRFGDGNTPLFTYTYMLNNEQPMRINATNFMAALWVIYGLKVANSKSYAYNNFFHAWWQLECYNRLKIPAPKHPVELSDIVYLDCGYIDMHTRTFYAPRTNVSMPVELKLGHMPNYDRLVGMNYA